MSPKLMVCVPDGKVTWRKGELEKGIEENVAKGPVLHMDFEMAKYHAERVQRLDPRTMGLLNVVFPEVVEPITDYSDGVLHIAGLIDLTLKFHVTHPGITTNWQYPEQLLHPAQQLKLTDVMLKMIALLES
jgi:hypothetical protein